MRHDYFITGTDTEIGKTHAACALSHALRRRGLTTLCMKPVAAGVAADGRNEDVAALAAAASFALPDAAINPYMFAEAIAPHLAAQRAGRRIECAPIVAAFQRLQAQSAALLVEGVGGFMVPLADDFDTADLAVALGLPVILVVGMRLGCLNHALLSAAAISGRGLRLAGWIANCIDREMAGRAANVATLEQRIAAPLLGVIAYGQSPVDAAAALTLPG